MNKLDKDYTNLLQDILDNGVEKKDRTGTGTISVFGRQIRHFMSDGFPLITTKKVYMKGIITELIWFLKGDTNIKYLIDNDCHIWDGDAYKSYLSKWSYEKYPNDGRVVNIEPIKVEPHTKEQFIYRIKTNDEFANKWGSLGKIYGFQWRSWGGWKETKQIGFLHKIDNVWSVKWSDLHSFSNGTEWLITPIQDSDQSLYSDEDEGKKVYYKNIILGYDEKSFYPIQVAKVIDDKFDKYVGGKDQIANLIHDLKTNPDSRRLMVNAWNVSELDQMTLPPCHYGFQVYTREFSQKERRELVRVNGLCPKYSFEIEDGKPISNKLSENEWYDKFNIPKRAISLMWNQRSVDTFLGLPFNIASYGLLLEIIAKSVNMVPDELIGNLGDTHLYSNHIEQAKEQIGRELSVEERMEYYGKYFMKETESKTYDELLKINYDELNIPTRTREPYPLPILKINSGNENWDLLDIDEIINSLDCDLTFKLENYQSHPTIKAPLSN